MYFSGKNLSKPKNDFLALKTKQDWVFFVDSIKFFCCCGSIDEIEYQVTATKLELKQWPSSQNAELLVSVLLLLLL